jgi:hypothetical protein
MNFKNLPFELNDIIISYCLEECKFCNKKTLKSKFCSNSCWYNHNLEIIEFIDVLIILLFLSLVLYNYGNLLVDPLNIALTIFVNFILIPTLLISKFYIIFKN